MDLIAKLIVAVVIAGLVLAAIAGITSLAGPAISAGQLGVSGLEGHSTGGHYFAYRDPEAVTGSGGSAVEMSPLDIVGWASALIFPSDHITADGSDIGRYPLTETSTDHRGWLLALLLAVPSALLGWLGIRWLWSAIFGGD